MFERALICTDLFDGLHRLVHCVPHLALSGLKQVIFLHSIPIWEQPTLAAVDQAKIDAAKEKLSPALANIPDGMTVLSKSLTVVPWMPCRKSSLITLLT